MRRYLGWIAIGWVLSLTALALALDGSPSPHLLLAVSTRAVALQLRCPVCQGESVADSPASEAGAMRAIIRQRLTRGESPNEVEAYFVSKYGNWILLAPPASGVGSFAWLGPPLLLLDGAGLLLTLVTDWRRRGKRPVTPGPSEYLDRVRAEVAATSPDD